jgi:uncharacterized protein (TIGR00251 family)
LPLRYKVRVDFGRKTVEVEGREIRVGITSKPRRGEANREVVRAIAKSLGVSSFNVRIVSGHRSRTKVVEVLEE